MRDLEIRGAGNLLGAEQHGHMEAVGYDLYCKMLNEAVRHLKGEQKRRELRYGIGCGRRCIYSAFLHPERIPKAGYL